MEEIKKLLKAMVKLSEGKEIDDVVKCCCVILQEMAESKPLNVIANIEVIKHSIIQELREGFIEEFREADVKKSVKKYIG